MSARNIIIYIPFIIINHLNLSAMFIAYLFLLTVILMVAFYVGRYIFWALFMKDAPSLEDFESRLGYNNRL